MPVSNSRGWVCPGGQGRYTRGVRIPEGRGGGYICHVLSLSGPHHLNRI